MKNQCNDDGFSYLETPAMYLFARPRTRNNVRDIIKMIHPILDYYIKYYLYKYRIYDNHPEHLDYYGDTYVFCCELLYNVQHTGNNFNRIKRYINKSISGWLYNKVYKKKKKCIELTKDELAVALQVDYRDDFAEVEYHHDLRQLKQTLATELDFYFELFSTVYGNIVFKHKEEFKKKYYDAAFLKYLKTGQLLQAIDFFENKYGNIFNETKRETAACGV